MRHHFLHTGGFSCSQQHLPVPPVGSWGIPRSDIIYNPSSVFCVYWRVCFKFNTPRRSPNGNVQVAWLHIQSSSITGTAFDSKPIFRLYIYRARACSYSSLYVIPLLCSLCENLLMQCAWGIETSSKMKHLYLGHRQKDRRDKEAPVDKMRGACGGKNILWDNEATAEMPYLTVPKTTFG